VKLALLVLLAIALPACARDERMTLRSPSFEDGGRIPMRHSCEGDNVSPPLSWDRVPEAAVELALVVGDPKADGGVFHHWVVLGIEAKPGSIAAGAVPDRAVQAKGSSENPTWIGPCPPEGEEHEVVFSLFPLSRRLPLADGVELKAAIDAIEAARIVGEEATLVGRFER
jgi:Raf kinase inhibitor-like YbhB/YbcL family protein